MRNSRLIEVEKRIKNLENLIARLTKGNKTHLSKDSEEDNDIIECEAAEALEYYQIGYVYTQSASQRLPRAYLYDNTLPGDTGYPGIVVSHAEIGDKVYVKISGTEYAYGSATEGAIATGAKLKPAGTAADAGKLVLDTAESATKFHAVGDLETDEDLVLVTFSTTGGGGAAVVVVKVTSKVDYNSYKCSVYESGPGVAATATDQDLEILQIAATETVPTDTWLIAVKIGDTYYAQPAIWY